jgi:hypothetical protein
MTCGLDQNAGFFLSAELQTPRLQRISRFQDVKI